MNYTITKEAVVKIARLSHIELEDAQIPSLAKQLASVLGYAALVTKFVPPSRNGSRIDTTSKTNILRSDVIIPTDSHQSLSQVPQKEGAYIVVPMILEVS